MNNKPVLGPESLDSVSERDFQTYYQATYILAQRKYPFAVAGFTDDHLVSGTLVIKTNDGNFKSQNKRFKMKELLEWGNLEFPQLGWRKAQTDMGVLSFFTREENTNKKGLRLEALDTFVPECMRGEFIRNFESNNELITAIFFPQFFKKEETIRKMLASESIGAPLCHKIALLPNDSDDYPIALFVGKNRAGEYSPDKGWNFLNPRVEALYKGLE